MQKSIKNLNLLLTSILIVQVFILVLSYLPLSKKEVVSNKSVLKDLDSNLQDFEITKLEELESFHSKNKDKNKLSNEDSFKLKKIKFSRYFNKITRNKKGFTLDLIVDSWGPIKVSKIKLTKEIPNTKVKIKYRDIVQESNVENNEINIVEPLTIFSKDKGETSHMFEIEFLSKIDKKDYKVELVAYNLITEELISNTYGNTFYAESDYLQNFQENIPNGFIKRGNDIVVKEGNYQLTKDYFFPKGLNLKFFGNVVLNMESDSSITSYANFDSSKAKVKITSVNSNWKFVSVIGSQVDISNITVEGGDGGDAFGMSHSCSFCLYNVKGKITDSIFSQSLAEDALNAKNSTLVVKNIKVVDNRMDGIDSDLSEIEIDSSLFKNNKGDGLDFFRSRFKVRNSEFIGSNDKGISVGEISNGEILSNKFTDNKIGIAVKDGSIAKTSGNTFERNTKNIDQYIKKSFYSKPVVQND